MVKPSKMCKKRLHKEWKAIVKEPIDFVRAAPNPSNLLEWHFVIDGLDDAHLGAPLVPRRVLLSLVVKVGLDILLRQHVDRIAWIVRLARLQVLGEGDAQLEVALYLGKVGLGCVEGVKV